MSLRAGVAPVPARLYGGGGAPRRPARLCAGASSATAALAGAASDHGVPNPGTRRPSLPMRSIARSKSLSPIPAATGIVPPARARTACLDAGTGVLLLPIPYFHIVFTLPHALSPLSGKTEASATTCFSPRLRRRSWSSDDQELGAQLGVTTVLHTWSQYAPWTTITFIASSTGGGLREDGSMGRQPAALAISGSRPLRHVSRQVPRRASGDSIEARASSFMGNKRPLATPACLRRVSCASHRKDWVVYAKRPFAGPEGRPRLSRPLHPPNRHHQSPHPRPGQRPPAPSPSPTRTTRTIPGRKRMTVSCEEFVRRLRLHILPERFVKIRHYGILSNRNRHTRIPQARAALPPGPAGLHPRHRRRTRLTPRPRQKFRSGCRPAAPVATRKPTGSWSGASPIHTSAPSAPCPISIPHDKLDPRHGFSLLLCPRLDLHHRSVGLLVRHFRHAFPDRPPGSDPPLTVDRGTTGAFTADFCPFVISLRRPYVLSPVARVSSAQRLCSLVVYPSWPHVNRNSWTSNHGHDDNH